MDKVQCDLHGEQDIAFVCNHLAAESHALGFHHSEESDSFYPDAWCDNCETIRVTHDGWNDESESLVSIKLVCVTCYRKTRARNTKPDISLDALSAMRWKCGSCDKVHTGSCLDFGFDHPYYWNEEIETSHCNENFCSINHTDYFVHGVIELPIIGTNEDFRWGVWGSLSKENFQRMLDRNDEQDLPAMFSWLSTQIDDYPNTLSLKMYAHVQKGARRPVFELEPTDHPLALQQFDGILPTQIREIMLKRVFPQ